MTEKVIVETKSLKDIRPLEETDDVTVSYEEQELRSSTWYSILSQDTSEKKAVEN